jgi:hypothetical protein
MVDVLLSFNRKKPIFSASFDISGRGVGRFKTIQRKRGEGSRETEYW